jgi:hypothetical protein
LKHENYEDKPSSIRESWIVVDKVSVAYGCNWFRCSLDAGDVARGVSQELLIFWKVVYSFFLTSRRKGEHGTLYEPESMVLTTSIILPGKAS